jgi:hypothetical protein
MSVPGPSSSAEPHSNGFAQPIHPTVGGPRNTITGGYRSRAPTGMSFGPGGGVAAGDGLLPGTSSERAPMPLSPGGDALPAISDSRRKRVSSRLANVVDVEQRGPPREDIVDPSHAEALAGSPQGASGSSAAAPQMSRPGTADAVRSPPAGGLPVISRPGTSTSTTTPTRTSPLIVAVAAASSLDSASATPGSASRPPSVQDEPMLARRVDSTTDTRVS